MADGVIMPRERARQITGRIKSAIGGLEKLIDEAIDGKAWIALGHESMYHWWEKEIGPICQHIKLGNQHRIAEAMLDDAKSLPKSRRPGARSMQLAVGTDGMGVAGPFRRSRRDAPPRGPVQVTGYAKVPSYVKAVMSYLASQRVAVLNAAARATPARRAYLGQIADAMEEAARVIREATEREVDEHAER